MSSNLHLPQSERANYLKQCWRTGRLQEGLREWSYPTRHRFYRWRQNLPSRTKPNLRFRFEHGSTPGNWNAEVPDLFASPSFPPNLAVDGLEYLFDEVDTQLQGTYRLAGGHYQCVRELDLATLPDNEQHHAYHRLCWAVRYAWAAAFGHLQAEIGLRHDLERWLSTDWSRDRRVAYPYTTAERIASLAEVLFWIRYRNLAEGRKLIRLVKQRVFLDAMHLSRNVEYWLAPHNHLLNDARALYVASILLPECGEAASWRQLAFQLWDTNFDQLVMRDGSFGEETSFYLLMNCRTALEYVLAARRFDHAFPEGLFERLKLMLELGNDLLRSDGSLPRFGNSSPDHTIRDLWGLMTAAHIHGLLCPVPRDTRVTPLTMYYCNTPSAVQPASSTALVRLYPEGGWAFLRRPELDAELVINGDTVAMTRGHGDCGRGSFELWWRGTLLIREPGNPTYNLPTRHWYRSGQGQNVTCVNGLPPGISHEYQERMPNWYCKVQDGSWQIMPMEGVIFQCKGFRRLPSPVDWERRWIWQAPGRLVMQERLEGQGSVQLDSYLHLGDTPWTNFGSSEWQCELPENAHHPGRVRMVLAAPFGTDTVRRPARFAPEYGIEKPGWMLVISGHVQLPVSWSVTWEFE